MSPPQVRSQERSANIFINYRREDSAGHTGRLFDALGSHFAGRLFMDVDTLEPGVDFVDAIEKALGSCEVLLVVIGREWLTIQDKAGRRRLDNPADFVRLELEAALERGIRVIPVLVQDTAMPSLEELPSSLARLARRNAIELSDARWAYDVERLARTIQSILDEKKVPAPGPSPGPEKTLPAPGPARTAGIGARTWVLSLAAAVLVAALVAVPFLWNRFRSESGSGAPSQAGLDHPAAVSTGGTPPAGSPTNGQPISNPPPAPAGPVQAEPSKRPPATNPVDRPAVREPVKEAAVPKTVRKVSPEPAKDQSPGAPLRETRNPVTVPVDAELTKRSAAEHPELPPVHATITAPPAGDTVGSSVEVKGTVAGLGDRRIFLCIKQGDGKLYPRGQIFPVDGHWSIPLRSSKEKTFEIMVVSSSSKEGDQKLLEQTSRDNGLAGLPPGASISSTPVLVRRQGRLSELFNPKRPGGK